MGSFTAGVEGRATPGGGGGARGEALCCWAGSPGRGPGPLARGGGPPEVVVVWRPLQVADGKANLR